MAKARHFVCKMHHASIGQTAHVMALAFVEGKARLDVQLFSE